MGNMGQNSPILEGVTERVQSPLHGKRKSNPIRMAVDNTIKAMIEQGSSVRKIAEALNISPNTVQRVRNDMKALRPVDDLKSGLMSPRLGEMSAKVVEHFLKKGAKLKAIKGSDAMAAVKTVADRQWPVRQEHGPASFSFTNVNLNLFLPDPQPTAQGAPVDTTCSVLDGGKQDKDENLNQFKDANVQ
jgi:DNA-binding transcriptional regulator YhcF (GntR family)